MGARFKLEDSNLTVEWGGSSQLAARSYSCGNCGSAISSNEGYSAVIRTGGGTHTDQWEILICHACGLPSFFGKKEQIPGPSFGENIKHLPKDIEGLYEESRDCSTVGAYTAAVLCCRKLLMHIAVSEGAPAGQNFLQYIEYLDTKGFIPPKGKGWVDHIRKKSNEANHEIVLMSAGDAGDLITFSEMLLRFIYEFPNRIIPVAPPS
jgi:hypothetical protein